MFAVYEGAMVLRLCATHEQSFLFMQQKLAAGSNADSDPNGAA